MNVFPVTTIEVGNSSIFLIKSVLYKTNESSLTLFEKTVFYVNDFCVGDFTDCEVSGVTPTAFIVALNKISDVSEVKKRPSRIPLGSNFDNYTISLSRREDLIYIIVLDAVSGKKLTEKFALKFEYFRYLCTSYYRMVSEIKSLVKDLLV